MSLWVVKIGTSLLRGKKNQSTTQLIKSYSSSIAQCKKQGTQIVLVSSGAVGLGCYYLGIQERPQDIVSLQAAAAVGQGHLMSLYQEAMSNFEYKVAQILLTRSDFGSRNSYRNASKTLKQLLEWGVLPIVNENDTLSSEELRYGDNDTLSSLVAVAIEADQLILLTDVDQLYSSDPRTNINARPIKDVQHNDELMTISENKRVPTDWGTGGISTKLAAARIATASGITVHLADGNKPEILQDILKGGRGGTIFHPDPKPIANRKSWLAHALRPVGAIEIDEGASSAIQDRGASLLLVGIRSINGTFSANQPVQIINEQKSELAKGLVSLSSDQIRSALVNPEKNERSKIVVHRDVLVLTKKPGTK